MNNINRRSFIKKSALAAAGAAFSGSFFTGDLKAGPKAKLNFKPDPSKWASNQLTMAWIGHSTVLINFFGKWILTDPVLSDRVGVSIFGAVIGPARLTPAALGFDEFPKPDLILLSHAHMDHMDYPTLKLFTRKYPGQIDAVTAYLTKDVIEDLEWKSVTVLDWNREAEVSSVRIRANEVKHFGSRYPWEKDRSRGYLKGGRSYNAYLLERKGRKIVFGGDTALTDKLSVLRSENADVAIMPIGAYNPWHAVHANPEDSLKMADGFGARFFCPIHTKTFNQSVEPFNEAIDWMKKSVSNYKLKLGWSEIGETFSLIV